MKKDTSPMTATEYESIVMKCYVTKHEYARLIGIHPDTASSRINARLRWLKNPRPAPEGSINIYDLCEWWGITIDELRAGVKKNEEDIKSHIDGNSIVRSRSVCNPYFRGGGGN